MTRLLDVYFYDRPVGKLSQDSSGRLSFAYNREYLNSDGALPLSIALPLRGQPFDHLASQAFFEGLLPEGDVRHQLADCLRISEKNIFSLLEAVAGECAGAVSLYSEDEKSKIADSNNMKIRILTDQEFFTILNNLKNNPFLADEKNIRLSLAGAQNKLPIITIHHPNNNYTIALSLGMPTTDILKIPIISYPGSVHNEFFCMQLAILAGINVPMTRLKKIKDTDFLLINRYDRFTEKTDSGQTIIHKLHQEDFCQALSIVPQMKYEENNTGPTLLKCLDLIQNHSAQPSVDKLEFIKIIIFNYLIGNADAHGKNFSLLYFNGKPRLAPAYDLLSTAVYPQLSKKMAMRIGRKNDPNRVLLQHWQTLVEDNASARKVLENSLRNVSSNLPTLADSLQNNLEKLGITSPIFEQIKKIIQKRAKHIALYF